MSAPAKLTLGPLLFNWPAEEARDFWFRIADEAPVDTVHLGEPVCAKRLPFLAPWLAEIAERLAAAGKQVVWSSLSLIAERPDIEATRALAADPDLLVEANDLTATAMLAGRPHVIGPTVNVYNEDTLAWLGKHGAVRVCLPPELPAPAIAALAERAGAVELEVFAFGRMPLALSARCYHARAHGLHKDGCQFVCGEDPDGMAVDTLDGEAFLAVNGTQTLSHAVCALTGELEELRRAGVNRFRLSPQAIDMVAVARLYRDLLDGSADPAGTWAQLAALVPFAGLSNGYINGREGAALSLP
jgi:collagenase-like PrtC family protease